MWLIPTSPAVLVLLFLQQILLSCSTIPLASSYRRSTNTFEVRESESICKRIFCDAFVVATASKPEDAGNDPNKSKRDRKKRKRSYISPVGSIVSSLGKFTKKSMKSMLEIVTTKHVDHRTILGKWKLTQEVKTSSGAVLTCPATIELLQNGTLVAYFEGVQYRTEYTFYENKWPTSCKIQFTAKIFQGPHDKDPRTMLYKGHFKKSLLNPDVVMMRGDMYQLKGKMYAFINFTKLY